MPAGEGGQPDRDDVGLEGQVRKLHRGGRNRDASGTGQAVLDRLACHSRRHRQELIGERTHQSFEKHVGPPNPGVHEVMEAEGVKGVDDDRRSAQSSRHPAEKAGLRGVSVNDAEALSTNQSDQLKENGEVLQRRDLANEAREALSLDACRLGPIPELAAR